MSYKVIQNLSTECNQWLTTSQIVEISCDNCDYDRGILSFSDIASAGMVTCNNPECESTIEEF